MKTKYDLLFMTTNGHNKSSTIITVQYDSNTKIKNLF